jgi:hypothetical protein
LYRFAAAVPVNPSRPGVSMRTSIYARGSGAVSSCRGASSAM